MRRIKLLLAVVAAMSMLMVVSAPAMADDFNRDCHPFCNDQNDTSRHHFGENDFFIDSFDSFDEDFDEDFDDFDEAFVELDDCEFVGWDGDEAVFVCELDF